MIDVEQIGLKKNGVTILEGVSVRAEAGEVLAVMGPNGAGKTSFLKVVSNEVSPTRGAIKLNGRSLELFKSKELALLRGYLPQKPSLKFGFRVADVVRLGRLPHGGENSTGLELAIAVRAMEETGVLHLASRDYTTLSGGEKQRVHLARIFAQIGGQDGGPERALLLDEPVAALDLMHQHSILASVARMARSGIAVIVVLHDINLAALYADKILLLNMGRVQSYGSSAEVLSCSNVEGTFKVETAVTGVTKWKQQFIATRLKRDAFKGESRTHEHG